MCKNNSHTAYSALLLMGLFSLPFAAFAQSDGSMPRNDTSSTSTAIPAIAAPAEPRATGTQTPLPATTTPRSQSTSPTPAAVPTAPTTQTSVPATITSPIQNTLPTENASSNTLLWVMLAALAVLPFGYLVAQSLKNKKTKEDEKDDSRCFDIKQLLDKKLKELTDLKGTLESKAKDVAKGKIREAIQGTSAGEIVALVENAEKEYGRLKKLYEECMVEFDGFVLKGTIVGNSLSDKSILERLNILKNWSEDGWDLYHVGLDRKDAVGLGKYLADGPWYAHFWKPGEDEVLVVFKNKTFDIKHSDKSTWREAVQYGESIGIPGEQLDFLIS